MKTLYLDCGMGAAGDMLTAALLELLPDPDAFVEEFNALAIPGVEMKKLQSVKCGIVGTKISILVHGEEETSGLHSHSHEYVHEHAHEHAHKHTHEHACECTHEHHTLHDIEHFVKDHMDLPTRVKEHILSVYHLLAEAESFAHGVPVSQIHFHEVGNMDAIADITAVCMLLDKIAPEQVIVSPIHVGSGHVRCAHGILPVPAPATAYILKEVPIYGGSIKGELCTPTGAALLKYFASSFGNMPVMTVQSIGYGMGTKDFEQANCIRAMLGNTDNSCDTIIELACNLDDMTPEDIGFAMETLMEAGALDVYTVPIGMKKSRPGTALHVLGQEKDREQLLQLLFKHTTTLGVRENVMNRYVLNREIQKVDMEYGSVRYKHSWGYGTDRIKYEYEDMVRIAKKEEMSLNEIRNVLRKKMGGF